MIAYREEFVSESGKDDDEEGFMDPDDDEDAENNWRNDYPDEDPLFYENMDTEYTYGEGQLLIMKSLHYLMHFND